MLDAHLFRPSDEEKGFGKKRRDCIDGDGPCSFEQMPQPLQELVFDELDTISLQRLSQTSTTFKNATFAFHLHEAMDYYDNAPAAVWQNATVRMYVRSGRALVAPGLGMTWTGLLGQTFDGYKFTYRGVRCAVM